MMVSIFYCIFAKSTSSFCYENSVFCVSSLSEFKVGSSSDIQDKINNISEVKEYVESDTIGNTPNDNKYKLVNIKSKLSKSPYGKEYKEDSYVQIVNNNVYTVCLTDGEYKATTGENGEIEVKEGKCNG